MSECMNISLFQTNPVWQDADSNLKILNQWIEKIPDQTNLVVLPEMFLTGFSMNVSVIAQTMDGVGVKWLKLKASEKGITIIGSLTIEENNRFYNRMLVALPNGNIEWYDKRHLFRMGNENDYFSPGNKILISTINGWKIMSQVCYDLRFPVWSRNSGLKYDLLIYVANWPKVRREAFLTLLKARAIENQCFVAAVNRVGTDGNGIDYAGDSVLIDPKGYSLTTLTNSDGIINFSISLAELKEFRKKFPTYLDADQFEII